MIFSLRILNVSAFFAAITIPPVFLSILLAREEKIKHYDFTNASKQLDIIYEDNNLMLLDKKVGLLCHPDGNEYVDTLI
mgnify:CR=1 FL=1